MDKALLDTDILSEVLKGINAQVVARAVAYRAVFGHYTVSLIRIQALGYALKLDTWRS